MRILLFLALFVVPLGCDPHAPTPEENSADPSRTPAYQVERTPDSGDIFRLRQSARAGNVLLPAPRKDTRSDAEISDAACRGFDGTWRCKSPPPKAVRAATTSGPILPQSWTVPAWFLDPANATTCASDNNNCTSATCGTAGVGPCVRYQEIAVHRWGTYAPRLRQITTLKWVSDQSGDGDPVYWNPYCETGAYPVVQGTLTTVASLALSATTAKNRNTPQLLQENLGASGAVGQLVLNSTHPSRAWVWKALGGNVFAMTQPLTAVTPGTFINPSEVDTWANTDSVSITTGSKIDLVQFLPVLSDINPGTLSNFGAVYQAQVIDPDVADSELLINRNVSFLESSSQRAVLFADSAGGYGVATIANAFLEIGMISGTAIGFFNNSAYPFFLGGALGVPAGVSGINATNLLGANLGNDVIVSASATPTLTPAFVTLSTGLVYVDASTTIVVSQGANMTSNIGAATGNILWGPGSLNVIRQARLLYPAGAGAAAAAFKLTGTLALNGSSTNACSLVLATGLWTCTNAVTAAQLDAVAGASTGGLSREPGGASIVNLGL